MLNFRDRTAVNRPCWRYEALSVKNRSLFNHPALKGSYRALFSGVYISHENNPATSTELAREIHA